MIIIKKDNIVLNLKQFDDRSLSTIIDRFNNVIGDENDIDKDAFLALEKNLIQIINDMKTTIDGIEQGESLPIPSNIIIGEGVKKMKVVTELPDEQEQNVIYVVTN